MQYKLCAQPFCAQLFCAQKQGDADKSKEALNLVKDMKPIVPTPQEALDLVEDMESIVPTDEATVPKLQEFRVLRKMHVCVQKPVRVHTSRKDKLNALAVNVYMCDNGG